MIHAVGRPKPFSPATPSIAAARAQLASAPYAIADLGLSPAERAAAGRLTVAKVGEWSRFGSVSGIEPEIAGFLANATRASSPADRQLVAAAITRSVGDLLAAAKADNAWVAVRTMTTTDAFNLPRWHIDGNFYKPEAGLIAHKFAAVVAGPGTLFADVTEAQRDQIIGVMKSQPAAGDRDDIVRRKQLVSIVGNSPVRQLAVGEGAYFRVGADKGGVHSEPPMRGSRIFFSVVTGTRGQIAEFAPRFGGKLRQ